MYRLSSLAIWAMSQLPNAGNRKASARRTNNTIASLTSLSEERYFSDSRFTVS
jgi:hypothetical protein